MLKIKLAVTLVVVLLSVGGSGLLYVKYLNKQIDDLTKVNSGLVTELAVEKDLREFEQKQNRQASERMLKMQIDREKAEKDLAYTKKLFSDHNLAKLMDRKPGLIEKRMINATSNIFQELEDVTSK